MKEMITIAKPPKKYSNLSKDEIKFIKKKLNITKIQDIDIAILKGLKENLKSLKDTCNQNMIIYKLWDEIHTFVKDNYKWLKSFLQMTGGIPTTDSYERIIGLVDSDELNKILFDFFTALTLKQHPQVKLCNFDGRVNNGSKRNITILNNDNSPLNCLNVYSNEYGYCIMTKKINEKTNEIPTVENLIKGMNLSGVIVTWDAFNSQTKNIKAVIAAGGDYVVPIKGNQGGLYQDLIHYFDDKQCEKIIAGNLESSYLTYVEKNHASIIRYECFQTSDIKWYDRLEDWEGIKTFGMIRKTVTKKIRDKNTRKNAKNKIIEKNVTTTECRYYISSRFVNIVEFNLATRGHWAIENKIHWRLDFTFCQDKNTTINKNALLNLEVIHKFVLATLERVKPKYNMSLKRIRKHLSNNFEQFFPEFICYLLLH